MLKNKAVMVIIFILLAGAIAYNVHFFYKRTHPGVPQPVAKPSSGMTTASKPTATAPHAASESSPPAPSPMPPTETQQKGKTILMEKVVTANPRKRALKTGSWGRNPFFTPGELRQIALLKGEATESEKLKKAEKIPVNLSGIIEVEHERLAIINNRVMVEGEEIGNIKLLKVLRGAVWVTVDNIRRWVPLPQSQIALVVQETIQHTPQGLKKENQK